MYIPLRPAGKDFGSLGRCFLKQFPQFIPHTNNLFCPHEYRNAGIPSGVSVYKHVWLGLSLTIRSNFLLNTNFLAVRNPLLVNI